MRPETMKLLRDTETMLSAFELGQIIEIDRETVNNWNRRDLISRFAPGGRRIRHRLFSTEELYKTALMKELVDLNIQPSAAREAVNVLWKEWGKKDAPDGWEVYAMLVPSNDKWNVALCSQKISGGPLYKLGKSMGSKSVEEMELPKRAFAVIPISDIFERVSSKLSELLGEVKNHGAKGKP
jgi:hypothetical protein